MRWKKKTHILDGAHIALAGGYLIDARGTIVWLGWLRASTKGCVS